MAVGASRCAGCDRRAVFFNHRHVSHQAPGLRVSGRKLHAGPLQRASADTEGTRVHLEEPVSRSRICNDLLHARYSSRGYGAQIEGLFQKGAGRTQSASGNAAEHRAGHRAHVVLELGLQGASDL